MAGDFGAGRANSVKARARDSGDLRSALTEFAPVLRCHYPGQAVSLETNPETYVVFRLWLFGDFLLRPHRLRVGDFRYMRALLEKSCPRAVGSFSRSLVNSCASNAPRETDT